MDRRLQLKEANRGIQQIFQIAAHVGESRGLRCIGNRRFAVKDPCRAHRLTMLLFTFLLCVLFQLHSMAWPGSTVVFVSFFAPLRQRWSGHIGTAAGDRLRRSEALRMAVAKGRQKDTGPAGVPFSTCRFRCSMATFRLHRANVGQMNPSTFFGGSPAGGLN